MSFVFPAFSGGFFITMPLGRPLFFFFNRQCYIYIFFIWLLRVLVEVCGILLLVRGWNPGPLHWEHRVLTNGPPGKFLDSDHFKTKTYILSL